MTNKIPNKRLKVIVEIKKTQQATFLTILAKAYQGFYV